MSTLNRHAGPRRRRDEPTPTSYIISGILTIAVLVAVSVVSVRAVSDGLPGARHERYYANFRDAGSLRTHDEVRIAGRRAGQVGDVTSRNGRAVVELKLDSHITSLPSDTQAFVRPRGLLGTRYVELQLGKSRQTLGDGDQIRGGDEALAFGVPDLLDTFDARTRAALGRAIEGLGGGLAGRGRDLNRTMQTLPRGMRDLRSLSAAVLDRPGAARRLMPSLASGTAAFDGARDDMAASLRPTSRALEPFVDRRSSVWAALEEAPRALGAANTGLAAGRDVLAGARALSVGARDALPGAPRALRATTTMLRTSEDPLRKATSLLAHARQAVPPTLAVTDRLDPLLDPLRRAMRDLLQPVDTLGRYGCDIESMLANWRSTSGQGTPGGDASGIGPLTTFRLNIIAGAGSLAGVTGRPSDSVAYVDRETYSPPCKNGPQAYDPSGLDSARDPGGSP